MSKPLSRLQQAALRGMNEKPRWEASAYDLRRSTGEPVSTKTMWALQKRGLVEPFGPGHSAFPANGMWRLTYDGVNEARRMAREGSV